MLINNSEDDAFDVVSWPGEDENDADNNNNEHSMGLLTRQGDSSGVVNHNEYESQSQPLQWETILSSDEDDDLDVLILPSNNSSCVEELTIPDSIPSQVQSVVHFHMHVNGSNPTVSGMENETNGSHEHQEQPHQFEERCDDVIINGKRHTFWMVVLVVVIVVMALLGTGVYFLIFNYRKLQVQLREASILKVKTLQLEQELLQLKQSSGKQYSWESEHNHNKNDDVLMETCWATVQMGECTKNAKHFVKSKVFDVTKMAWTASNKVLDTMKLDFTIVQDWYQRQSTNTTQLVNEQLSDLSKSAWTASNKLLDMLNQDFSESTNATKVVKEQAFNMTKLAWTVSKKMMETLKQDFTFVEQWYNNGQSTNTTKVVKEQLSNLSQTAWTASNKVLDTLKQDCTFVQEWYNRQSTNTTKLVKEQVSDLSKTAWTASNKILDTLKQEFTNVEQWYNGQNTTNTTQSLMNGVFDMRRTVWSSSNVILEKWKKEYELMERWYMQQQTTTETTPSDKDVDNKERKHNVDNATNSSSSMTKADLGFKSLFQVITSTVAIGVAAATATALVANLMSDSRINDDKDF